MIVLRFYITTLYVLLFSMCLYGFNTPKNKAPTDRDEVVQAGNQSVLDSLAGSSYEMYADQRATGARKVNVFDSNFHGSNQILKEMGKKSTNETLNQKCGSRPCTETIPFKNNILQTDTSFFRDSNNNNLKPLNLIDSVIYNKSTIQEIVKMPEDTSTIPETLLTENISCSLSDEVVQEIEKYRPTVEKIINFVVDGQLKGVTYNWLAKLTETFGHRMTGSKALENATDWLLENSEKENLENIRTENFKAPYWVRNSESLNMLEPLKREMTILGLGSSVSTETEGIIAEVVVVNNFNELDQLGKNVSKKIVVYNPEWTSYGEMVKYRGEGASRAAPYGAVATLVRSVTPFSINSPHTGWQRYQDGVKKIPTACITQEDAETLKRYYDKGIKVVLKLEMNAQNYPDTTVRNILVEREGKERPDEIVVVSGHLDSWDVGVGAMDDGGGSMVSWMVPIILSRLKLRAKRTIRTVLFSGEEQGLHGGKAYYDKHSNETHTLLLESDIGTFDPLGISFSGTKKSKCIMGKILELMSNLNTTKLATPMSGGPDIEIWKRNGFPVGSILNANARYFWFHHSEGDRMTVEDSDVLDRCAALWAAVAYVVADMNNTISR